MESPESLTRDQLLYRINSLLFHLARDEGDSFSDLLEAASTDEVGLAWSFRDEDVEAFRVMVEGSTNDTADAETYWGLTVPPEGVLGTLHATMRYEHPDPRFVWQFLGGIYVFVDPLKASKVSSAEKRPMAKAQLERIRANMEIIQEGGPLAELAREALMNPSQHAAFDLIHPDHREALESGERLSGDEAASKDELLMLYEHLTLSL